MVDLLLLDLKRRTSLMGTSKAYTCPFGLKAPQHPIIMLMQKNDSNLNDLTNKINGICNHHDKEYETMRLTRSTRSIKTKKKSFHFKDPIEQH